MPLMSGDINLVAIKSAHKGQDLPMTGPAQEQAPSGGPHFFIKNLSLRGKSLSL